jgi:hypothetical protein
MASTTDNFNLDLYDTGDPAALTDQYNSAMHTIDKTLLTINDNAQQASTEIKGWLGSLGITNTSTAKDAKTKWDNAATLAETNENNITAINANLSALGADSVANAGNSKTKWDNAAATAIKNSATLKNVYTKTESDERYVKIKSSPTELVAIGDSYFEGFRTTNPTTDSMIVKASNKLNLTCRNFAVGGSGFITGTTTFSQQLDAASKQITNKENVKFVVIGGGRNDNYNTLTEHNVVTTLNKAHTLFPNSKIIFIPMMWDNTWPTYNDAIRYGKMCAGARASVNTQLVRDAITWGLFYKAGMTDIHPNTEGSEVYAQYIAHAIQTGATSEPRQEEFTDITLSGVTDGGLHVYINGPDVKFDFRGKKTTWDAVPFATLNTASTFGAYCAPTGFTDQNDYLKIKFDGLRFSLIDVLGSGVGANNKIINFQWELNVFNHN